MATVGVKGLGLTVACITCQDWSRWCILLVIRPLLKGMAYTVGCGL